MITFQQLAPNIVLFSGLDLSLATPQVWRAALERAAKAMQRGIYAQYMNEMTATGQRFRRNSLKWTLFKERKGYDLARGRMLGRIVRRIRREDLFSISAVTAAGTAVVTFDEQLLYIREPHARWYARTKVPGGIILTVNRRMIARAAEWIRVIESRGIERRIERLRRQSKRLNAAQARRIADDAKLAESRAITSKGINIQTGRSADVVRAAQALATQRRRPLTLARTAWRAAALTEAKLRRL